MVVNKGKKAKIEREGDQENEHINEELVQSIEKLQEIQDGLEKVNEEASEMVLEVEQKYNEKRRPVYLKRNEVMQYIPDFWLTAFLSHPVLCDLLTDEDQKIFKYLVSLDMEDSKDVKSGYIITVNFSPNPYFEDTKLVKSYTFLDDGRTEITGTTIKWKDGMNVSDDANHEKKGTKRPANEESFFTWFGETEHKSLVEGTFDEVADLLKEDLWPNPLRYFNNETDEEDFDGDDDEDEDADENDEEEDTEEEE